MANKKSAEGVKALHPGMSVSENVQGLKVPRRAVYNIKKRLDVRETTERKPGGGRPNKIKRMIQINPAVNYLKMHFMLNLVSYSFIHYIKY